MVFAEELAGGDGGFDLVNPLLDVLPVFPALPLDGADLLQHGPAGALENLIIDLIVRPVGACMISPMR